MREKKERKSQRQIQKIRDTKAEIKRDGDRISEYKCSRMQKNGSKICMRERNREKEGQKQRERERKIELVDISEIHGK